MSLDENAPRWIIAERNGEWKVKPENECSFSDETLYRVIEEDVALDALAAAGQVSEGEDWWAIALFQEHDPLQVPRGVIVKRTLEEAERERGRWQAENNGWLPRVIRVEAHQHPALAVSVLPEGEK